jgi:hypothetical protein
MDFQEFIQNFAIKIHNIKGRCSFTPPGPGTSQSPLLHTRGSCFTSELVTLYRETELCCLSGILRALEMNSSKNNVSSPLLEMEDLLVS